MSRLYPGSYLTSNFKTHMFSDINECEGEGCGDPLEECVNSPGSYECICKSGYDRVAGKCQLEGIAQIFSLIYHEHFRAIAGVHVVLFILGVSSLGLRGAGVLIGFYMAGGVAFFIAKFYKEGL